MSEDQRKRRRRWLLGIAAGATLLALLLVGLSLEPSKARVAEDVKRCYPTCELAQVWRGRGVFPAVEMRAAVWCAPADLPLVHTATYRWQGGRWNLVDSGPTKTVCLADGLPTPPRPAWRVRVLAAAPSLTYRHLRDRKRSRIIVLTLEVDYEGPSGAVWRPLVELLSGEGQPVGQFRTMGCRGGDKRCNDNLAWLVGIPTAGGSRTLTQGDPLADQVFEWWFEAPKDVDDLQLKVGDAPAVPLQLSRTPVI
jgi:hypothetical protein